MTSKSQEEAETIWKDNAEAFVRINNAGMVNAIAEALSLRDKKIERMEKVIEAAKNLNLWCGVSHGHVLGGYAEVLIALEEYEKETK